MDGAIYFIDRDSPAIATKALWIRESRNDELPALRSISDIAWVLWKRQMREQNWDVKAVKRVFSFTVVNKIQKISSTELFANGPRLKGEGELQASSVRQELHSMQALHKVQRFWFTQWHQSRQSVVLPPYFLVQHKLELGNNYIPKITIFCDDDMEDMAFYGHMLFLDRDVPSKDSEPPPGSEKLEVGRVIARLPFNMTSSSYIVRRIIDGNTIVRDHVFALKAKL
ncbi:hypothetical protein BKA63DRAFT_599643 [Paraphoma chrysanthemicola]|nr:hypothetical protein BKA63DRAFT_599643 [Paraphoma chrysanthemicola]